MKEVRVRRDVAYMFRNRLILRRIHYVDKSKTTILVPENAYDECVRILKELEFVMAGRWRVKT
ncbi:hypothetical protein [Archaeoglobus veneficus]|uniref:Uncharacterized protein n=1 Tax=Archaeoglobus veneficus (strain DSM 11195 / SNP6) TaxID=693661 RepID=F2KRZ5_ARCVS|nr:hypothetical protein [Archaeoglobus veneficus]AEA46836.1 hypothetical protein Arcve_0821 [Archaeoglobus veneficus SNP6]